MRGQDGSLADPILNHEDATLYRIPSNKTGLIQVDVDDKSQEDSWNSPGPKFLEKLGKVNFVKRFGKL